MISRDTLKDIWRSLPNRTKEAVILAPFAPIAFLILWLLRWLTES